MPRKYMDPFITTWGVFDSLDAAETFRTKELKDKTKLHYINFQTTEFDDIADDYKESL